MVLVWEFLFGLSYKQHVNEQRHQILIPHIYSTRVRFVSLGACEGTLACSTCHVVLKKDVFDKLPNKACDEELDMLDLAYGLTDTCVL